MPMTLPNNEALKLDLKAVLDACQADRRQPFPMQHAVRLETIAHAGLYAINLLFSVRDALMLPIGQDARHEILKRIESVLENFAQAPKPAENPPV